MLESIPNPRGDATPPSPAPASTPRHLPLNQLPDPYIQGLGESQEGPQPRVHGCARFGFTLLELLVGEGGDAGSVSDSFLIHALGQTEPD